MKSQDTAFLVSFAVGSILMLIALVVGDWLAERKAKRKKVQ